jgi:uncharacterized paraquat-inducible protein A
MNLERLPVCNKLRFVEERNNLIINTLADILSSGCAILGIEKYQTRLSHCLECKHSESNEKSLTCTRCGCNMNIKARFAASKCPLDKWDKPPE